MLPNFLIIGAAKAASTWLSDCLGEHPDIFMAEIKEVRFFTQYYEDGLEWYQTHFEDWSGQKAVGEATPGYLGDPDVPGRIKETLGDIKLIASFRHPIDRAYSAFWHFSSHGAIPLGDNFETHFKQRLQKAGHYITHINRYLEYFPREKMLFLIYEEDVKQNPQTGAKKCFEFLDVNPEFTPEILKNRSNKARDVSVFHNQGWAFRKAIKSLPESLERPLVAIGKQAFEWSPKKQKGYIPLNEDLRQELFNKYYRSEVEQLEDFLNRDLSIWYETSKE